MTLPRGPLLLALALLLLAAGLMAQDSPTLNTTDDGYRGIWYFNQKSNDPYVYKYSGGLGTYCAKHKPFAVYSAAAGKTFFCYGGTSKRSNRELHHMVSWYDHEKRQVPRPTILLDKKTSDAHDNPVISLDDAGHVWIFSTSHGRARPSYIHRSRRPYSIDAFERVSATYVGDDGKRSPLTNFSYFQAWHVKGRGFACFFTRYADPAKRTNMFMTSADGVRWSRWQRLATIEDGHYQVSGQRGEKAGVMFNYHPAGKGLNWRTNLYYIETSDLGATWRTAAGRAVDVPITTVASPALIRDYRSEGLLVYLKDLAFDEQGYPVLLYVTSKGYRSGPANDPRTWTIAHWTGKRWAIHTITTSDNNYDMGSLYLGAESWRIIAPTQIGPQPYNPGGEVAEWISGDRGATWKRARQLTERSPRNHTYVRRPVNAQPGFRALWADGHGREPSASDLYFADDAGRVYRLPRVMTGDRATPALLTR